MNQKIKNWKNWVEMGADVEFLYKGKKYTLIHIPGGVNIGEQNNDEDDNDFSGFTDLMNNYVIDGVKFKDAVENIEILFSSF